MSRISWKSAVVGIAVGALLFATAPVIADIGDPLLQGQANVTHARTTLRGVAPGANLRLIQQKPDAVALAVFTEPGIPPMSVNRKARVKNLNADLLDGRHRAFFAPAVPQAGDVMRGVFSDLDDNTDMVLPITFTPTLPYELAFTNMHYVGVGAEATAECPGNLESLPGHLCVYASWENTIDFVSFLSAGPTNRHGVVLRMLSTGVQGNVRGTWVYTVPAVAPAAAPAPAPSSGVDEVFGG